ncbi:hypothetical protein PCL_01521 [Purpureocillium lilacinum]|uniref:Uncharacterized protein n=1 Tax=Purpureocillium lilacinum TaxID=33203 RepID=A0A2U3E3S3_PURLI|nr:hypothetical protein PCL_01521 [Purpureocillium lilacinum]
MCAFPTSDRVKELEAAKVSARYEERPGLVSFAGFARRRSTTQACSAAGWLLRDSRTSTARPAGPRHSPAAPRRTTAQHTTGAHLTTQTPHSTPPWTARPAAPDITAASSTTSHRLDRLQDAPEMDHPRRVIQTVSQSIPQRTAAPGFETRFESAPGARRPLHSLDWVASWADPRPDVIDLLSLRNRRPSQGARAQDPGWPRRRRSSALRRRTRRLILGPLAAEDDPPPPVSSSSSKLRVAWTFVGTVHPRGRCQEPSSPAALESRRDSPARSDASLQRCQLANRDRQGLALPPSPGFLGSWLPNAQLHCASSKDGMPALTFRPQGSCGFLEHVHLTRRTGAHAQSSGHSIREADAKSAPSPSLMVPVITTFLAARGRTPRKLSPPSQTGKLNRRRAPHSESLSSGCGHSEPLSRPQVIKLRALPNVSSFPSTTVSKSFQVKLPASSSPARLVGRETALQVTRSTVQTRGTTCRYLIAVLHRHGSAPSTSSSLQHRWARRSWMHMPSNATRVRVPFSNVFKPLTFHVAVNFDARSWESPTRPVSRLQRQGGRPSQCRNRSTSTDKGPTLGLPASVTRYRCRARSSARPVQRPGMTEPIPSGNVRTCESRSLMAARVERGPLDGVVLLVRCETPIAAPKRAYRGSRVPSLLVRKAVRQGCHRPGPIHGWRQSSTWSTESHERLVAILTRDRRVIRPCKRNRWEAQTLRR